MLKGCLETKLCFGFLLLIETLLDGIGDNHSPLRNVLKSWEPSYGTAGLCKTQY
jgi:hypothetical protein